MMNQVTMAAALISLVAATVGGPAQDIARGRGHGSERSSLQVQLKPRNTPQEQRNEDIANVLFKEILQYGHVELAEQVMAPGYIQHNPNVPTGRRGFVDFVSRLVKPEPIRPEWKDEPELILTNGNIVFYMFRRFSADPSNPSEVYKWNWFDMVRVDGGLIQEHWDSARKTPPPASVPKPAGFREYR